MEFSVKQLSFSSSVNDEFAPVFYSEGIVFCSNSLSNTNIKSEEGRLFNILYSTLKDSGDFKNPELFSKELTTILNEGPATFSTDGNTIFFARNNQVIGKFKDINIPSNTMGIYSAELKNGVWSNLNAFPFNSNTYSLGTPALSPDGKRLYFASDMPGGYGGTDIYYTDYVSGEWQQPVNLGGLVNTTAIESYPWVDVSGKLFFASDGHPGKGGKDIFFTVEKNGEWLHPIHLGEEINSEADDYGLITDINFKTGYFSSNRKHSHDIYSFTSEFPQFGYCDTILTENQCFVFYDDRFTDTLHLTYEWNFGKGIKKYGYEVEQCFTMPGNYEVVLTITHNLADSVFLTRTVHRFEVPASDGVDFQVPEIVVAGHPINTLSRLNGFNEFSIDMVHWNFGSGYSKSGASAIGKFNIPGKSFITIGLEAEPDSYGTVHKKCFTKELLVAEDIQSYALKLIDYGVANRTIIGAEKEELAGEKNTERFSLELVLLSDTLSGMDVVLLEEKITQNCNGWLDLKEDKLTSQSAQDIEELVNIFSSLKSQKILMAVHASGKGNDRFGMQLTQALTNQMQGIFFDKGFNKENIEIIAYGNERPLYSGKDKKQRKLNQRIEIIIVDKKKTN
jgi:outer membrane protein OmpA-like peptidoglycan-associated protein